MSKRERGNKQRRRRPLAGSASSAMDDRVRRSKELVLRATSELLTATGLGGVSVDEVARQSGVAKTTIYRHWPTRSDLLMEACSRMTTEQAVPDTGSLEGDLTVLLTSLATLLLAARWSSVLPSVIDAAERDPAVAEMHGRLQKGHALPFQEVIKRATRRGEISPSMDSATMVAALMGPLFYRRWFSRESLDDRFVRDVVERVVGFASPTVNPRRRNAPSQRTSGQ